jgi:hypothetical protein
MKIMIKIIFCILITVFFFSQGCSGLQFKNFGKIVPQKDVTDAFEHFQLDANYNYYISGSDVYPTSILGLTKDYKLDTDVWNEVEMTPKVFTFLVANMEKRLMECCFQRQQGFAVMDNKGKKIGVWYSMLSGNIVVQMKEGNKVIIYPPSDTDDYKAYEGRLGDKHH